MSDLRLEPYQKAIKVERQFVQLLEEHGFNVFHTLHRWTDILARKGECLFLVEVKSMTQKRRVAFRKGQLLFIDRLCRFINAIPIVVIGDNGSFRIVNPTVLIEISEGNTEHQTWNETKMLENTTPIDKFFERW